MWTKATFFKLKVLDLCFKKKHGDLLGFSVLMEYWNYSSLLLPFLCPVSCLDGPSGF